MKKEEERNLVPKRATWRVKNNGSRDLREILDLREKRWRPFGSVGGRRRRAESAQEKISNKKRAPEEFWQNCKITLGSTLGVDSWHRKIHKNDEKIWKNLKLWGKSVYLEIDHAKYSFELLKEKRRWELSSTNLVQWIFGIKNLELERYLSWWIKDS